MVRGKSTQTLILSAFTLLASGCAGPQIYQDATGPSTAKLRLRMEEPIVTNLGVAAVDVKSCKTIATFAWVTGGVDSLYAKRVGMLDSKPPAEGILEYVIPAGKPLAARTFMHVAKLNWTHMMVSQSEIRSKQPVRCPAPAFLPQTEQQYEIVYNAGPGRCTTHIFQLKDTPQGVTRVDITNDMNLAVVELENGEFVCRAP